MASGGASGAPTSRLEAAQELRAWLEAGGPTAATSAAQAADGAGAGAGAGAAASGGKKKKGKAARAAPSSSPTGGGGPYLLLSDKAVLAGDDGNVTLRASRPIEPGELILGVARACALHPRSEAVDGGRRTAIDAAAARIRAAADAASAAGGAAPMLRTPMLNVAAEGWIELVVLVALELLDGEASAWWPYLRTLPQKEFAATPSLWPEIFGDEGTAAVAALRGTSIAGHVDQDVRSLTELLGGSTGAAELLLGAGAESAEGGAAAREAFVRAIGLALSRSIEGVGLVPFMDMANGVPNGMENAKFERTNLAHSASSASSEPCIAIVSTRRIAEGDEILCAYGMYTSADFLYRYGWVDGGPDATGGASSPHDKVGLPVWLVFDSLSELQRSVLERNGLGRAELEGPTQSGSPFAVPAEQATKGAIPSDLQQVAMIACCQDEGVLREMAETGRASGGGGITRAVLAKRVAEFCADHVRCLAAPTAAGPKSAADASVQRRLAERVRVGERERQLRWMMGLQAAHQVPKEIWGGAMKYHIAACKGEAIPEDEE